MTASQEKPLHDADESGAKDCDDKKLNLLSLLKRTWAEWTSDNGAQYGAALAFYSLLALSPLLLFLVSLVAFFFGDQAARGEVVDQIRPLVGSDNAETIQEVIRSSQDKKGSGWFSSIVGVVTMLIGASGVFTQLQIALNAIWDVKPKEGNGILNLVKRKFLALTMVFGSGFLLLVSLVISIVLKSAENYISDRIPLGSWFWGGLNLVVTFALVFLLFGAIYKVLPEARIRWKHVAFGAFIAAALFMVAQYLLTLYLGYSAPGSAYGAAGSVVAMVIWIYFSAQILLLGAEFAQVYATRCEGRRVEPTDEGESTGRKPQVEPAE
ncbi:MAG TPA: YihY/virulence factor BrkB family protein [Pirellulaceae bacterium]|jgi:membrane protein|nr:YihY/virulence factor BrkB family protein [Pirellulaceae bacterium]